MTLFNCTAVHENFDIERTTSGSSLSEDRVLRVPFCNTLSEDDLDESFHLVGVSSTGF